MVHTAIPMNVVKKGHATRPQGDMSNLSINLRNSTMAQRNVTGANVSGILSHPVMLKNVKLYYSHLLVVLDNKL